jgi:peptidoglycan L-alanyl-D-glutamate endopeptidase CwlK
LTFKLSQRDHDRLDQIHEDLAKVVRRAAEITEQPFCVTQGLRTLQQQRDLYAQGRTKPGKIVTWTMNSQHLSGRAVDLAAIDGKKILWDEKLYPTIAKAMLHAAAELHVPITWGGTWKNKDLPHFELRQLTTGEKT